jgi:hypothetical protein
MPAVGPAPPLAPLTLEDKAINKRFNKALDRVVATSLAFGLGLIAYGTVQELLRQRALGDPPMRLGVVVGSGLVGVAFIVLALTGGYIFHRRED